MKDLELFAPTRNYADELVVTETRFFQKTVGLEQIVHDEVLQRTRDPLRSAERLSVRAHIWERVLEDASVRHPATWWDAFKLRWYPRWMLRRWPARVVRIELHVAEYLTQRVLPPDQSFVGIWHQRDSYLERGSDDDG